MSGYNLAREKIEKYEATGEILDLYETILDSYSLPNSGIVRGMYKVSWDMGHSSGEHEVLNIFDQMLEAIAVEGGSLY